MKNLTIIGAKPFEKPDIDLKSNNLRVTGIHTINRFEIKE